LAPTPPPPYLVIREGKSFWVEARHFGESSATLQALEERCFHDAWCYDASGRMWPIVNAALKARPSFLQRLCPWRPVPVELQVGMPTSIAAADIVARLATVLRSSNAFCEGLSAPPTDILAGFASAQAPSEIIAIARDYVDEAE
jgi:hypothetical protein